MLERIGARRAVLIAALGVAVAVGAFAATNLASSTVYYLTPTEAKERGVAVGQTVRLGGQVVDGSLRIEPAGRSPSTDRFIFVMTDGTTTVSVVATSMAVPGLLREGEGAIVEGSFAANGMFVATQVIAKHDEVYTAPTPGRTPPHRTPAP